MLRRKSKPTGVRQLKGSEENAIGLRASERRFRALLENSWIGITMLSAEATILYINQSVTRILGFGVEELVGQNAFRVIHPDDRQSVREAFARVSKSPGSKMIIEYRSRHRDGSWRWIEAIGTNLLAEPGVNAILCNYQDITRRRQVEAVVVESEERFRVALKTSPVVLFNQDRDLRYTWIYNPSRGYSIDEVEGKTDAELLSADDAERLTRIKRRVIETGTSAREEVELTSAGIRNVYDLNIEPMLDALGKISGITCVALDITERKRAEERIRELGAIVESSDDAIFGRTLDGLITSWNKGAEKIYGYAEDEVIGQPVSILVPVDRQDEAPEIHGRVAQGESISHYETVRRRKDGQEIHVSLTSSPFRNWEGRIVGASTIARDITEGKRIDEALRQSEKRFAAFMANMPAFAWIKDVHGRYLYVNQMMEKVRQYSTGWCGKTDAEIWPSEIAAHYTANDQKVITSRKALQTVEPYSLEGEQRCVLVSKFPIFDETGAVAMVGGASVEITERVRTEEALRESEERFRELAENIDEVFWMSDPKNTRIIYVSPAYERIWGRSRDTLYAFPKSWTEAIHPEDKGQVVERIANRDLQGSHDLTYRIARPDGSIRRIRDRGFPVYDASGNIVRIAGISEDVTESKEAEEALQQANAQLHVLSRRLFQVQEDERRHLARELHDQIGQALTAAKIDLQAAQRLEEHTATVQRLDDSIAILERLLQQVRQLSLELRPPLLDDLGLVPALRWYLDQQAQRAVLRVEFFADPALERVDAAIETACFRVAQEALTNVVRHARAQTVSVELHRTPEALHLVVRDDGIGFDVMTAEQGASLGLLGMRERVALLAGEMDCKSAPGRGTEIHAFFPVRTHPDAQEPGP
jgi:PAS domain S-box-containing protein